MADGPPLFVKVYAQDARDADLLYRGYRTLLLRGPGDERPSTSLAHDVEHEALMLMLARRAGVRCPEVDALHGSSDGSVALALECIDGQLLDELPPDQIDDALLDAVWREVATIHAARLAHGALRAGNILVAAGRSDDHRPQLRRGVGDAPVSPSTGRSCSRRSPRSSDPEPSPGVGRTGARPRRPGRPRSRTSSRWRCRPRRASQVSKAAPDRAARPASPKRRARRRRRSSGSCASGPGRC